MKNRKLTPEEAKKLQAMGFKVKATYKNECQLCGKKFSSKYEKCVVERMEKHLDEECAAARQMRGTSKMLEILGLKNVVLGDVHYVHYRKFPEGYERTDPEELDILNRLRDFFRGEEE